MPAYTLTRHRLLVRHHSLESPDPARKRTPDPRYSESSEIVKLRTPGPTLKVLYGQNPLTA